MKSTEDRAQEARLRTYADDWRFFAQGMRRKAARDIVGGFIAATDCLRRPRMVVSLTKSVILASGGSARAVLRQVAGAFGAQVAIHVKDIGVDDTLAASRGTPAQRKRVRDAVDSAARVARLPHGWRGRARFTASLSGGQSKWGAEIIGLPGHAAGKLRSAYFRAVSGGNAVRRAPEVTLALAAPGGFLDPALNHTRQVILAWAKRVDIDHSLVEWVAQAWNRGVDQPPPSKPRGPIALIVKQLRKLGWEPTEPATWHQGMEPRSVFDLEGFWSHLDRALSLSRWEGLAGRKGDYAGGEGGIDEEASFREPLKALQGRRNNIFGRYACILSGGTWTRDRHSRAGFDVEPCCPLCRDTRETPIHRWWACPRWDVLRGPEGRKLAIEAEAADWQPRCLRECGLLLAPCPEDCPPAPPREADCGKPRQRRFPGNYLVYTDASAVRPEDPYLRRAACAFWAGDSTSDAAAWSLPGLVQTVYCAELFAILVALEVFRGDAEIVSDCRGRGRAYQGGRCGQPHLQARGLVVSVQGQPGSGGTRQLLVRWVPPHEKEDSDRISPEDRSGNDQADRLANALAKRIGPTAKQGKLYDQRVRRMAATQGIQLKILTASQASGPPRMQGRVQRGPGAARGSGNGPARPRKCHLPTLEPGELRLWGPHLIAPHGSECYRCMTCGRTANHKRARYAFKYLPCRCGLGGAPRPCRPRLKWNRANEARWRRQGEGGHQAVRYNSAQHDGRWLCMRCGLHYMRFCDLRTKRCTGVRGHQLARRPPRPSPKEVHAFAKHPSGSWPGAPGARLRSDRFVLDPSVLRPPGPAAPQAQGQVADTGPGDPMAHVPTGPACPAQDEAHDEPQTVAGDPAPVAAKEQRPGGANHEGGRDERPHGIRAFLGLGPGGVEPGSQTQSAVDAGKVGKPVKPKAKPAQGGLTGRRARKPRTLPEPSGDPRGHVHRWLGRGVTGGLTGQDGTPGVPSGPQVRSPGNCQPGSASGTGPQSCPRRLPVAPGSSTDPPLGRFRPGPHGVLAFTPGGQGSGQGGPRAAECGSPQGDQGSRRPQRSRVFFSPREAGTDPEAGAFSEDEGIPPRVSFIPDFFVPIPRGEGDMSSPDLA